MPSAISTGGRRPAATAPPPPPGRPGISAVSARTPPSPWLSARMTMRDVLDRDDEQQRVDDQRQHAEHVLVRRRHGVRPEEALAHRVQRAGADVAVDDAERGEREGKQTAATVHGRGHGAELRTRSNRTTSRIMRESPGSARRPRARTYELFMTFLRVQPSRAASPSELDGRSRQAERCDARPPDRNSDRAARETVQPASDPWRSVERVDIGGCRLRTRDASMRCAHDRPRPRKKGVKSP